MVRGKPVILPSRNFANQTLAAQHFAAMLKRYKPGDRVSDEDAVDLAGLVQRHPEFTEKEGVGIDHFEVQSADYGTQCFRIVRKDGTWDRFSYKTCVAPDQVRD
ncbi:DCL family protein [Methylobacterium sp. J-070]|uniref:DCL family protein n=1 Tax=Methylobacterium sp. J-070 TaxID=2836650 RepID=UPI001FBB5E76|nr:DCL family protein [Methylobacterium sp. J-070]MCJ2050256.1 DCL family protein [Methylobacterium sp. J-070]